jgi:hypothetical protein
MLIFTTATYDESPYMDILSGYPERRKACSIVVPIQQHFGLCCCIQDVVDSDACLFISKLTRRGELPDPFTIDPEVARQILVCYWNCVISPYGPKNIRP